VHLDADGDQQAGLCDHSEGLVVAQFLPITPHGVQHGAVGDEEEDQGAEAAVKRALEECHLAEVQVALPGHVELRVLEAPHVVHILASRGRRCPAY